MLGNCQESDISILFYLYMIYANKNYKKRTWNFLQLGNHMNDLAASCKVVRSVRNWIVRGSHTTSSIARRNKPRGMRPSSESKLRNTTLEARTEGPKAESGVRHIEDPLPPGHGIPAGRQTRRVVEA
jgi:hypothetical protein